MREFCIAMSVQFCTLAMFFFFLNRGYLTYREGIYLQLDRCQIMPEHIFEPIYQWQKCQYVLWDSRGEGYALEDTCGCWIRCISLLRICASVKEASTAHSYSQAQALRPRGVIKRRDRGTGGGRGRLLCLHNTMTTTAQQINHFVEADQWPRWININLALPPLLSVSLFILLKWETFISSDRSSYSDSVLQEICATTFWDFEHFCQYI